MRFGLTLLYLFLEHERPDDNITINSGSSSNDEDHLQLIGVYYLHIPLWERLSGYISTYRHILLL